MKERLEKFLSLFLLFLSIFAKDPKNPTRRELSVTKEATNLCLDAESEN